MDSRKPVVVYSVAGEGFGHASVAIAMAEALGDEIELHFLCGGKAYSLLKPLGLHLVEIPYLGFQIENNRINQFKTMKKNAHVIFSQRKTIAKIKGILSEINPDVVLTDFEYFVPRAARKMNIPVVQMSREQVLLSCKYRKMFSRLYTILQAQIVTRFIITKVHRSIGLSFSVMPLKKKHRKDTLLFPPLRQKVMQVKPIRENKIVAYFSSKTYSWIEEILETFNESFVIYGLSDTAYVKKNLTFKPISHITFLEDLSRSKAVISTAGHSLLSEALYLRKPAFVFPIEGQYEQMLNAFNLHDIDCGRACIKAANTAEELQSFINDIPQLTKQVDAYSFADPRQSITYLKEMFEQYKDKK